jgi:hypothetical protein
MTRAGFTNRASGERSGRGRDRTPNIQPSGTEGRKTFNIVRKGATGQFCSSSLIFERVSPSFPSSFVLNCGVLRLKAGVISVPVIGFNPHAPRMGCGNAEARCHDDRRRADDDRGRGVAEVDRDLVAVSSACASAGAHLLRGVALGPLAHTTMLALVASWLMPYGRDPAYGWASLSAVAVNGLALSVMNRTWCRRGPLGV